MELYNKKENPSLNPDSGSASPAESDLRSEGVDIVGSGVREENEFTGSDTQEATTDIASSEIPTEPAQAIEPKPDVAPAPQTTYKPSTSTPGVIKNNVPGSMVPPAEFFRKTHPQSAPVTPVAPPATIGTPKATAPATTPKDQDKLQNIRTFKMDAEEAVKYHNVSAIDIAVAEQKKREGKPMDYVETRKSRAGLIISSFAVFLMLLGGGYYYFMDTAAPAPAEPIVASVQTLIPYSSGSTVPITDANDPIVLIAAKISSANPGVGNVFAIVPTLDELSTTAAGPEDVFASTGMPSRLERSLAPEYMIGSYLFDTNAPFMILKNTFYQNAYAGLLEWERDMMNDLLPLIRVSHPDIAAATSGTSAFEDTIVANTDARVLRDEAGEAILIYAFANTETIVITTTETALKYLLEEILSVKYVQ